MYMEAVPVGIATQIFMHVLNSHSSWGTTYFANGICVEPWDIVQLHW